MKSVLWVSRHEMTAAQLADLERIMGGPVRVLPWRDTLRDPTELFPLPEDCAAIAAVLPPDLLADLFRLAHGVPVLRAVSAREPTGRVLTLPDGRREPEFAFGHQSWEQLLRAEFVFRRL